jgi:hypothetical protein
MYNRNLTAGTKKKIKPQNPKGFFKNQEVCTPLFLLPLKACFVIAQLAKQSPYICGVPEMEANCFVPRNDEHLFFIYSITKSFFKNIFVLTERQS